MGHLRDRLMTEEEARFHSLERGAKNEALPPHHVKNQNDPIRIVVDHVDASQGRPPASDKGRGTYSTYTHCN